MAIVMLLLVIAKNIKSEEKNNEKINFRFKKDERGW